MPKYRFTTDDGKTFVRHDDTVDLPGEQAAADEAQRGLADLAQAKPPDGTHAVFRVAVEDEADEVVYQASLEFKGETREDMRLARRKNERKQH